MDTERASSIGSPTWSWSEAYTRVGATRDERFNAGTIRFPNSTTLRWDTATGERRMLHAAEIEALVGRLANSLHRIGVRSGDRVAGFLGRRPASLATPLAVWRLGAIYVPLFTNLGVDAIKVRMEDSDTHSVVTDTSNRDQFGDVEGELSPLRVLVVDGAGRDGDATLADDSGSVSAADTKLDDPGTIIFTSGTTARPKGCVLPHRAIVTLWPYVDYCLALDERDVFFSTADPGWTYGLFTTGLSPMACGYGRILYERGYDTEAWWTAIEGWGVTHMAGAPTGFRQLAASGTSLIEGRKLRLRALTSAGEPLTPEVFRWFREHLGVAIHDSYGLTELGMLTANLRMPGAPEPTEGCMGSQLPGFTIRLVDDVGNILLGEGQGRLAVRDDGQFLSMNYWGREAEWNDRLQDGCWVTEDIVRADDRGRFWYVGRRDDVIVSAGYNISPNEVETVILEHPLIVDAGCVGELDLRKGQVIVAHVVLNGPEPPGLLEEVRKLVGTRLGWHAAPRRLHVRDALPRTESGKMKRRDLRAPGAGRL